MAEKKDKVVVPLLERVGDVFPNSVHRDDVLECLRRFEYEMFEIFRDDLAYEIVAKSQAVFGEFSSRVYYPKKIKGSR